MLLKVNGQHALTLFFGAYRSLASKLDSKVLSVWFSTLVNMRSEIASWTARASKHTGVGYPLITILLCLEDTPSFAQFVDTLMDNLHRQLKVCSSFCCLACSRDICCG